MQQDIQARFSIGYVYGTNYMYQGSSSKLNKCLTRNDKINSTTLQALTATTLKQSCT